MTTDASSDAKKLPLTGDLLSSFRPAKVFTAEVTKGTTVSSLSFDDTGSYCVTAGEDNYVHVYDARRGTHAQKLPSLKYGVHLARFTHDKDSIIHASTLENNAIRYLSLKTKMFIRYFEGHKNKVVALEMSPVDDTFLSASINETVQMWDLRTPKTIGSVHIAGHPVVSYDAAGKVFAMAINERSAVLLYDIRKIDQAPFLVVELDDSEALSKISMPPRTPIITSLKFSPAENGRMLLIGTSSDVHYIIDTFEYQGQAEARLVGHQGLERVSGTRMGMVAEAGISGQEFSWTPDGKWVIAGSADGSVCYWLIDSEEASRNEFRNLRPKYKQQGHDGACRALAFNPRFARKWNVSSPEPRCSC